MFVKLHGIRILVFVCLADCCNFVSRELIRRPDGGNLLVGKLPDYEINYGWNSVLKFVFKFLNAHADWRLEG